MTDEGVDSLIFRLDFVQQPKIKTLLYFCIVLFKALMLFNFTTSKATHEVRDHLHCSVNIIHQFWI